MSDARALCLLTAAGRLGVELNKVPQEAKVRGNGGAGESERGTR